MSIAHESINVQALKCLITHMNYHIIYNPNSSCTTMRTFPNKFTHLVLVAELVH